MPQRKTAHTRRFLFSIALLVLSMKSSLLAIPYRDKTIQRNVCFFQTLKGSLVFGRIHEFSPFLRRISRLRHPTIIQLPLDVVEKQLYPIQAIGFSQATINCIFIAYVTHQEQHCTIYNVKSSILVLDITKAFIRVICNPFPQLK